MNDKNQPPSSRFARDKEASRYFQIGRSTLWLWVKTREGFPQPHKMGERVTLFDLNEIEDFLRSQGKTGGGDGNPA